MTPKRTEPRVFPRFANKLARVIVFGFVFFLVGIVLVSYLIMRSPLNTGVGVGHRQPVPFSHERHVRSLEIDCRYCHSSVETSSFAGMPPTETCMQCHSQVGINQTILQPVRLSYETGQPLEWMRVSRLPDYVHFNHSIHLNKGVGCVTCHGRIDEMVPLEETFPLDNQIPVIWQAEPFSMQWCLNCHRNPERFVMPREQVFNMKWQPPSNQDTTGRKLVEEYKIRGALDLTSCSVCHY
ncbi:MAG: cytochrome C [Acidobacteria bacterium 13_1_20CM_3_53_8]|nr:MAG: cytochrome C [Acidobacteria bacterium 13_1_20CM_3_53_8]